MLCKKSGKQFRNIDSEIVQAGIGAGIAEIQNGDDEVVFALGSNRFISDDGVTNKEHQEKDLELQSNPNTLTIGHGSSLFVQQVSALVLSA